MDIRTHIRMYTVYTVYCTVYGMKSTHIHTVHTICVLPIHNLTTVTLHPLHYILSRYIHTLQLLLYRHICSTKVYVHLPSLHSNNLYKEQWSVVSSPNNTVETQETDQTLWRLADSGTRCVP